MKIIYRPWQRNKLRVKFEIHDHESGCERFRKMVFEVKSI